MPGPVPREVDSFSRAAVNTVRSQQECMAYVGAVAVAWTELEGTLELFVGHALGSSRIEGPDVVGYSPNKVARIAMEQAETIRTRLKLIDALVAPILTGTSLDDEWAELKKELQKQSRKRNSIVHGRWAYSDKLPNSLVKMDTVTPQVWTPDDFWDVLHAVNGLSGKVQRLTHKIGKAKAEGRLPEAT